MPDDYTDDTQTTGTVAVGGSVTGEIESNGDNDWFAVTLEAGKTYQFDLKGSRTGAGTLSDPFLRGIYDAGGTLIDGTENDNGGTGSNSRVTFKATADATYYVSAGGHGDLEGTYTLSVGGDDFADGTGTAGAVTVGGSVTGKIDSNGDHDWFAVTLEAGKTYQFDLEGSWTGGGTLRNPQLRGIYDANGNRFDRTTDDDSGYAQNSRVSFTPSESGTYYVSARGGAHGEGTYRLSVTGDDIAVGTGTDGTVEVDGSVMGEIDSNGERDWFAVTLQAGNIYRFFLEGSATRAGTLFDPYLRGIYDAEGNLFDDTTNDNSALDLGEGINLYIKNSEVTFTAPESATYYVSAGAKASRLGTYKLSVRDITESFSDDFTDGTDTAGAVRVGRSATGELGFAGDRDWFAVTLQADKTYRFDLVGRRNDGGTLSDPELYGIYDADGGYISGTTDDNGGTGYNSRVTFTARENATYYVSAGAFGGRIGTYTLSVRDLRDDFTDRTGTSGTVAVGGSVWGEIGFVGDRDWFAVTLAEGRTYEVYLDSTSWRGRNLLPDPYLRGIYDADGVYISGTTNDNGGYGFESLVTFTATDTATYYVSAGGGNLLGAVLGVQGTYKLSVTDITVGVQDDFTEGTRRTGTVAVGGSTTGEIESEGDRDWFAVTLVAGRTYQFDLEGSGTGDGALSDPYLYGIYDADGTLIGGTTDDNGGSGMNSRVTFEATEYATYYVSASAPGNEEGTYSLSVTNITVGVPDDFTEGTRRTGTVTVGGSARGGVEFVGDRDWFAVTLEADKFYQFDLEGSGTGDGALYDPYLYGIYDAGGNLIEGTTNDDRGSGRNSRVTFEATADATYYVSASAYGNRVGAYTLSVRDVTDSITDDFTAGTGTAGAVTVGGSAATGGIDFAGDRDWFAVTLEAGKTYRFDLEGSKAGAGTLGDPYLYGIYNADGSLIEETRNDDGGSGLNSQVTFTAAAGAVYYVSAGAFEDNLGAYELSVEEVM